MRIPLELKLLFCAAPICCALTLIAAEKSPSTSNSQEITKHVDAKQAAKLISDHQVIVLDIRTPGEFKSGHIAGATNIDFNSSDFQKAIASLSKTNSYLVHCAVGGRSTRSLKLFEKNHFESIYHLDGGIDAWKKAGLPTEK